MIKIKQIILNVFNKAILLFSNPYYGFIQGHSHIDKEKIKDIKSLIGVSSGTISEEFEGEFSKFIGLNSVSFAAGRMGFYSLLKILNVKSGDEVILTGFTCSVMVNAVLRVGATPVYADISKDTLGTSAQSVEKNISLHTKIIVAQHSFGIPCEIDEICKISKKHNIFLLEDCALALDSSIHGRKLGLFGDASLFSFDHTKPINAMIGGVVCTKDNSLYLKLKEVQKASGEISLKKQTALFKRFLLERKYCNPKKYGLFQIIDYARVVYEKIFNRESAFLMNDSEYSLKSFDPYPYPSKMPEFISFIALNELKRWPNTKNERQYIMRRYIEILKTTEYAPTVSELYCKDDVDITPLRFVFTHPNGSGLRNRMDSFLNVDWTWFKAPIISIIGPIENYGYMPGTCPVSESIGKTIVNFPTSIKEEELDEIIKLIGILKH
jgi:dTDP-4-amino-4,6-dideoxygalactose transaminase